MWDTAARFHVWPWPYKFAVILNLPAALGSSLLVSTVWPNSPDSLEEILTLPLAVALWYWVGLRLDRRWSLKDIRPWIAISVFCLTSIAGTFLRIGHVDFLPYGLVLWGITVLGIPRFTAHC